MTNEEMQKKIEALLRDMGVPGFIIFGWQKDDDSKDFNIISSFHEMPINPAIKGISHVLHEFIQKTL